MGSIALFWKGTGEVKKNTINTLFLYMPFKILRSAFYKTQITKIFSLGRLSGFNYNIGVLFNRNKIYIGVAFCVFHRKFALSAAYL